MTNLTLAIALQSLWQEYAAARIVIAFSSAKKEREHKAWFARNPRVQARIAAQKPYHFV